MPMQNLVMFKELGLSDEILLSIQRSDFTVPTPIQDKSIPQIFMGHDLLMANLATIECQ
jgi:superfamily II DNA/RNA helicase